MTSDVVIISPDGPAGVSVVDKPSKFIPSKSLAAASKAFPKSSKLLVAVKYELCVLQNICAALVKPIPLIV